MNKIWTVVWFSTASGSMQSVELNDKNAAHDLWKTIDEHGFAVLVEGIVVESSK